MHIHILGICGTFMGSLALLARDLGHRVTGSDANVYPPMSTQLEKAGIEIMQGYDASHLQPTPDLVVVGNAMKRGIEAVEYLLGKGIPYTSGPQFLSEQVLQSRHVLAVAGTHGKTTTTTMLAWVLQYNNLDTGFLIGGVPIVNAENNNINANTDNARLNEVFAHSGYLGSEQSENSDLNKKGYFVIEADEYDSAFFDKRSKFVHYRPATAILNNLEFDHADIFKDLEAIQTQFHHMIRMIPSSGRIIMPSDTESLETTIDKGCWTPIWRTALTDELDSSSSSHWQVKLDSADGSKFTVLYNANADSNNADSKMTENQVGSVDWTMSGIHNVNNGLMAIAAAIDVGISVADACKALSNFAGIKRRMELIANINGIKVYDDFAHHPTAIQTTLDGAKKKLMDQNDNCKLWAVIEPRSNTMKMGIHRDSLANSCELADEVLWYEPAGLEWGLTEVIANTHNKDGEHTSLKNNARVQNIQKVYNSTDAIIKNISTRAKSGDVIVIMSNGSFEGIHQHIVTSLDNNSN